MNKFAWTLLLGSIAVAIIALPVWSYSQEWSYFPAAGAVVVGFVILGLSLSGLLASADYKKDRKTLKQ